MQIFVAFLEKLSFKNLKLKPNINSGTILQQHFAKHGNNNNKKDLISFLYFTYFNTFIILF